MDDTTFLVRATTHWLVRPNDFPTTRRRFRTRPSTRYRTVTDPGPAHRDDAALDRAGSWTLEMSPVKLPEADILEVSVHFVQRIPVRLSTLLATGLGLSRAEVTRGIAERRICSQRALTGRCARDFSFVFRWQPAAMTTGGTPPWQSLPSQTGYPVARVAYRLREHRQPQPHQRHRGLRHWRRTAAPRP